MSNTEKKSLMDTAEFEAVVVFDRCAVVMAQLENGAIITDACATESAENFDEAQCVEECMRSICEKVQAMEAAPAFTLTPEQAKIIISLAEHNLKIADTAKDLGISAGTLSGRIKKIREQTGGDPMNFLDMTQLLTVAVQTVGAEV